MSKYIVQFFGPFHPQGVGVRMWHTAADTETMAEIEVLDRLRSGIWPRVEIYGEVDSQLINPAFVSRIRVTRA